MTENTTTTTYPVVTRLDVGFDMVEDRLIAHLHTVADGTRVVLITRRLMRLLLDHHAALLRRTSETAARAPAGQRDEVLRMEHVGALSTISANGVPPVTNAAAGTPPAVWLAREVQFRVEGAAIIIGFMGQRRDTGAEKRPVNEPIGAMTLNRADAHRILAMLAKRSKDADWGLEHHAPWLTEAGVEGQQAIN